ncbi:MAG TPA: squalene synthase HpnC [Solirubrobacteraceae bacterium]|jgi:squalene synthase HpnC
MLIADMPTAPPTAEEVMARAATENFPVSSWLLPRRARSHLLAIYGFARLVDELGDGPAPGRLVDSPDGARDPARHDFAAHELARTVQAEERLAALDWVERDLDRAYAGRAEHALLVRLQPTLRDCALPREPFVRLIEANRLDQRVSRYETWAQLRAYCALSADPVGELVLGVLGLATPARIALSNSICTALQLAEHCQDIAEDLARGRVYLPAEDLARCGCAIADLTAVHAGAPLRELLAFEVSRAHGLLDAGAPLIDELPGARARLAVAAFAAGGRAALEAIERAGYDVLAGPPRAGKGRRALVLAATLACRRGRVWP